MNLCPVCGLEGGFHDHDNKEGKHAQHVVPRDLVKESGWHKIREEPAVEEEKSEESEG